VLRECIGEFERALDRFAFDRLTLLIAYRLKIFAMRVDCGIARGGCFLVHWIVVCSPLVFLSRLSIALLFEQQIGELVIDRRRFAVGGE